MTDHEKAVQQARDELIAVKEAPLIEIHGRCPHHRGHFDLWSFISGLAIGFFYMCVLLSALVTHL